MLMREYSEVWYIPHSNELILRSLGEPDHYLHIQINLAFVNGWAIPICLGDL